MSAAPAASATGRLRDLFDEAGATWLDLPVLQPADAFLETAGEDIRRRMFVTEGGRGERLALRPDFTIPVCLHHISSGSAPRRYAYEGAVFRRSADGASERFETGYEDIGRLDRTAAEVEAIQLATDAAGRLTGQTPALKIGDIGLFSALLKALDLPPAWRRTLRLSFGVPDKMAANLDRLAERPDMAADDWLTGLDPSLAAVAARHDEVELTSFLRDRFSEHGHSGADGRPAAEIARRFLEQQSLRETHLDAGRLGILRDYLSISVPAADARGALSDFAAERDFSFGDALDTYAERVDLAASARVLNDGIFTAAFGRPLDYYTGLVFELNQPEGDRPLAGGGRYDGLMQMLGTAESVPAIGFTVRLASLDEGRARK